MFTYRTTGGLATLLLILLCGPSHCLNLNSGNLVKTIGYKYEDFKDIRFLNLQEFNIETIAADTIRGATNLRIFILEQNPITELPQDIFRYNNAIRILQIHNNSINSFHRDIFKSQVSAVEFYLNDNLVAEIDEGLFKKNINLTVLDLSGNKISELKPLTFEKLKNLRKISLSGNRLTSLPEVLFYRNRKLRELSLRNNRIKTLSWVVFSYTKNLQRFYIDGNRLSTFDLGLFFDNKIEDISVANNDLTHLVNYNLAKKEQTPELANISLNGNNFNCSYFHQLYSFFTGSGISVYTAKRSASKRLGEDTIVHENTCIEDDKYDAVSRARISAADAPFKDIEKTYYSRELKIAADGSVEGWDGLQIMTETIILEGMIDEQERCENGETIKEFVFNKNCDYFSAYTP